MKNQGGFKWTPKLVAVNKIKPTPKNYKIKNELGAERLKTMLQDFGLAGTVVVNTDYVLIDGNSRLEEAKANGETKIWVSMPNKKLDAKQFKIMSSMFDAAKAGDVDMDSIIVDLGKGKSFLEKFKLDVPIHLLDKMGKNARVEADISYKDEEDKEPEGQFRMVQLFLTPAEEKKFRQMEDILMKQLKTEDTTQTVYKALRKLTGK